MRLPFANSDISGLVDNTDLLKAFSIVFVVVDHLAIYFVVSQPLCDWMQVFGRLAAPIFFYLIGFATSRRVPMTWIALACILTVLDAWGDNWQWGPGSILFSFCAFRFLRPFFRKQLRESWVGSFVLVGALVAASALPTISRYVEPLALDGPSGWLWALMGLAQREYIDAADTDRRRFAVLRWLLLPITVCVFWLRTKTHYTEFTSTQMTLLAVLFTLLALVLVCFKRGPSRWQPGGSVARALRFGGHHTLEIYAAQLIISPIILAIWPDFVF